MKNRTFVTPEFRVARASRVLAMASLPSRTFFGARPEGKDRFGETPKPARETRALPGSANAFTIIELLIVMSIIIVLAGLVIATSGYVQEKSKRSRTEAEIAAMSAALESYKADNGIYPTDTTLTDGLNPAAPPFSGYEGASAFLYRSLAGDSDGDRIIEGKPYFNFKPNMLAPQAPATPITAIRDPFGNPYGYSTAKASQPTTGVGFNPTFDLWSTAGTDGATPTDQAKWIKNW